MFDTLSPDNFSLAHRVEVFVVSSVWVNRGVIDEVIGDAHLSQSRTSYYAEEDRFGETETKRISRSSRRENNFTRQKKVAAGMDHQHVASSEFSCIFLTQFNQNRSFTDVTSSLVIRLQFG